MFENQIGMVLGVLLFSLGLQASTFASFDEVLKEYVKTYDVSESGFATSFDYQKAKKNPKVKDLMTNQAQILAKFKILTLKTKNEATAFWINTYNFFMVSEILSQGFDSKQNLKIDGVKNLGSILNPYAVFNKSKFNIGGKKYSLDAIEKSTLLGAEYKKKGWKDARIHFAVNCASISCPPLLGRIYRAETLDNQLSQNVTRALSTSLHLKVMDKKMQLTQLFQWYEADFAEHSGSVEKFLLKYANPKIAQNIRKATRDGFIDYDWKLNTPAHIKEKLAGSKLL